MKNILAVIGGIAVVSTILFIIGVGAFSLLRRAAPPTVASSTPTDAPRAITVTSLPGGSGARVAWGTENALYRLKIHNIEFAPQFGSSDIGKADEGSILVALDVEVTALSQPLAVRVSSFRLKDLDNFEYDPKQLWGRDPMFKDQDDALPAGASARGWITFEIPATQQGKLDVLSLEPSRLDAPDYLRFKIPRNAN